MQDPFAMASTSNSFVSQHFLSCKPERRDETGAGGSRNLTAWLIAVMAILSLLAPTGHAQSNEIIPVSQVREGMQGYAYTIFAGDQVEKFDLEVIGVMPNFLGPRQSIILVQLKGPKVEHTGVVAGMSGSPVYLEGKLAGALALKFGRF